MLNNIRKIVLISGDILCAYFSLFLTVFFGFWGEFSWQLFNQHLFPFSILYGSWFLIFYIFDLYSLNLAREKFLFYSRVLQVLIFGAIVGIAFFYLWPAFGISPKTNLILNLLFFGSSAILWRKIFYVLFSKTMLVNVVLIGKNKRTLQLAQEINNRPYLGYKIVDLSKGKNSSNILETSKIKNTFLADLKKQKVDILIVGEALDPSSKITNALYECLKSRIDFLNLSEAFEIICGKVPLDFIDKNWLLDNLKEGEKKFYDKSKILIDSVFAIITLIISLPLWLIIALAIKIEDKGKVFYKQKRIGKDKKEFLLIKFRSMEENAENGKAVWAGKKDLRTTKFGALLRKTHLDELPQLINILKGNIALVGPRPERPEFVRDLEKQIPFYHLRHLVKPGLTGWAQIKFRYARTLTDSFEKFEYDLYYLKNRNIFLDLGIVLKTFQFFFRND